MIRTKFKVKFRPVLVLAFIVTSVNASQSQAQLNLDYQREPSPFSTKSSSLNQILRDIQQQSATAPPPSHLSLLGSDSIQNDFRLNMESYSQSKTENITSETEKEISEGPYVPIAEVPVEVPVQNFAKTLSSIYKENGASDIETETGTVAVSGGESIPEKSPKAPRRMTLLPSFNIYEGNTNDPFKTSSSGASYSEPAFSNFGEDTQSDPTRGTDPEDSNSYAAPTLYETNLLRAAAAATTASYPYQYPLITHAAPYYMHLAYPANANQFAITEDSQNKSRRRRRKKSRNPFGFLKDMLGRNNDKDTDYSNIIKEDLKLASLYRLAVDVAQLRNSLEGYHHQGDMNRDRAYQRLRRRRPPPPTPHRPPTFHGDVPLPEGSEIREGNFGTRNSWPSLFTTLGSNMDTIAGNVNIVRRELSRMRGEVLSKGIMMGGTAVHEAARGMAHVVTQLSSI